MLEQIFAIGLFGLFYMMANLDRSNLGNAQIAGMPEDIGLTGNQFGTATTLLLVPSVMSTSCEAGQC